MGFSFYGPTCDDLDHMAGPFELPADVQAGDYIEVGMLGAYGCAMRTGFNGFGVEDRVIVDDEPMASLYGRRWNASAARTSSSCSVALLRHPAKAGIRDVSNQRVWTPAFAGDDRLLVENQMTTDTLIKTSDEAAINDTRKAELLAHEVEHIDIKSFDARPIVEAMGKMSFTSRDLSRATDLYNQMLADPEVLGDPGHRRLDLGRRLHGPLCRAGALNNMVDAIVATGAAIVDMDFFEALGHKHYQALEIPDDDTLRSLYIDRIYDTYIDEDRAPGLRLHHRQHRRQPRAAALFSPRVHQGDGQVAGRAMARRTTASSSSPTSMTCRSSARRSPTARRASASSSTRSMR